MGEGDNPVDKVPDAEGEDAKDEFADAGADLAAHEAVYAKAAKDKGKDPDKEVFVDFLAINEFFGSEARRSGFGDKIGFAVFVDFYFVSDGGIFIFDRGNRDGGDGAVVIADFYFAAINI